jgi:hypothetical protein
MASITKVSSRDLTEQIAAKDKKEYFRQYYLRYQSHIRQSNREYYNDNKNSRKIYERNYYIRNKDIMKGYYRDYYIKNKENPGPYIRHNKSWKTPELVRKYFDSIAHLLSVSSYMDWYRISRAQIRQLGGTFPSLYLFISTHT